MLLNVIIITRAIPISNVTAISKEIVINNQCLLMKIVTFF
jgi:hypothetical protein